MSDWLDAARGRFEFLRRVAEHHGCAVRVGTWSDEEWLGGAVAEEKRIFINMEQSMGEVAVRWLLEKHGKSRGVDAEACEWAVATWVVAHELGHYELHGGADLAQCDTDSGYEELLEDEADMFARRFLRETVGLPASEAAERCGLIANQIRDKNPGKRAL